MPLRRTSFLLHHLCVWIASSPLDMDVTESCFIPVRALDEMIQVMIISKLSPGCIFLLTEAWTPSNPSTCRAMVMYSYSIPVSHCCFSFVYPASPDPRYAI
jgi:hypothetical protein